MRLVARAGLFSILATGLLLGCGPAPMPAGGFTSAPDLLGEMAAKRSKAKSFRITGKVDHFGEQQRVRGNVFLFGKRPASLRIDLLSGFGSTLSVLTVHDGEFSMADHREQRYMRGPAEPCNIARLVRIPLPAEEVMEILVGGSPVIEGEQSIEWDSAGFYKVTIRDGALVQTLEVDPDTEVLALRRSRLKDDAGVIYDLHYDRWRLVNGVHVPHEIKVEMPREKADLLLLYDEGGVEVNVSLPKDAWDVSFPDGAEVEEVTCFDAAFDASH